MISKLPAGHYQNMIDAIRKLAASREAAAQAIRTAAESAQQRRHDAYHKMQRDALLAAKPPQHG